MIFPAIWYNCHRTVSTRCRCHDVRD